MSALELFMEISNAYSKPLEATSGIELLIPRLRSLASLLSRKLTPSPRARASQLKRRTASQGSQPAFVRRGKGTVVGKKQITKSFLVVEKMRVALSPCRRRSLVKKVSGTRGSVSLRTVYGNIQRLFEAS